MRKKTIFIHNQKKYSVKEPTVGLYWTFLIDLEQFLEELFLEFNNTVPKIDKKQTEKILEELFNIKPDLFDKIFSKITKEKIENKIDDFHIIVGKYIKFFPGENYSSVMNIPINLFNKMLTDSKIIDGEEKYDKNRHSDKPDKKGIRKIFNNQ